MKRLSKLRPQKLSEIERVLQSNMCKEIRKDLSAKTKECEEDKKRVKAFDFIIQTFKKIRFTETSRTKDLQR